MTNILLLTTSPRGAASYSTRVAEQIVARLQQRHPGATLIKRTLADRSLPYIDESYVIGRLLPSDQRSAEQQAAVKLSEQLVNELFAADFIVIGSAMINFGIAAPLKTWFDYLLTPGMTFRYGEKGPVGLVIGKKIYLALARGGIYSQGPMGPNDFQEPYVKVLLGFMGMTDVEVIRVEGIAYGPEAAEKAYAGALEQVAGL